MKDLLKNFLKQFLWEPEIENKENLKKFKKVVIIAMGGSASPGEIVQAIHPSFEIEVIRDYGKTALALSSENSKDTLYLLMSFSGLTEEVLEAVDVCRRRKLSWAVISSNGELLKQASRARRPLVELPIKDIPPRMATGYFLRALTKLLGLKKEFDELSKLPDLINRKSIAREGQKLAKCISSCVPIIYSSSKNSVLAYNFKTRLNETGKKLCFFGTIPECCHNEIEGFEDKIGKANRFCLVLLKDTTDHPRVIQRMNLLREVLKGQKILSIELKNYPNNPLRKIIEALMLADWTAFYLALSQDFDPQEIRLIKKMKNLLKKAR